MAMLALRMAPPYAGVAAASAWPGPPLSAAHSGRPATGWPQMSKYKKDWYIDIYIYIIRKYSVYIYILYTHVYYVNIYIYIHCVYLYKHDNP